MPAAAMPTSSSTSPTARDLIRALDPGSVASEAGIVLDPWQQKVLEARHRRLLLNCARQTGKSTVVALRGVAAACYSARNVLIVSPSQRQSQELLRSVKRFYGALHHPPLIARESATKLELATGARILALPGTEATIRGLTADLVIVDEAARVPDELFVAVRPMLSTTDGQLIALSTPYGRRGWFYEAWMNPKGWQRIQIRAEDCPRIAEGWLKAERETIGEWAFRQEFGCEFVDTEEQFFSSEIVEAAMSQEIAPLWAP